ncbi:branched-chain amino acid transport system II carrier protein [Fructilactobacillus vespulae]|uniref:branched-chain amino acid transport system II carrier protein n=1 Tax=Fructilactobacillus vespulae TaxID=1249630 RepID=UPI0039B3ED7A
MENKSKIGFKQYLILASLLFGLFFGAGNLIFPINLGQTAGPNWVPATIGFLLSSICLPLFSILALSITKSKSMYNLAEPAGKPFAIVFLVLTHASLGLLIAAPRTATVTFSMGVQPFLPKGVSGIALLIFSFIFFLVTLLLAFNEQSVTRNVGKVLNPLFIILMILLFFIAFCLYDDIRDLPLMPTSGKGMSSFTTGFLEGYNTMDALAGLSFGITIITAIEIFEKRTKQKSLAIAKVGSLTMGFEALIYTFLIALGAGSLSFTKVAADGGQAFTAIMRHYTGIAGAAILAALTLLACLTTAIGLLTSLSQDLSSRFKKISYKQFLIIATVISFGIANFGLTKIILYSAPILSFLYPLAISLILLGMLYRFIGKNTFIYKGTIGIVMIPAVLDLIHNLPPVLLSFKPFSAINRWGLSYIPLFEIGLDFIPFLLIGLIGSLIFNQFKNK